MHAGAAGGTSVTHRVDGGVFLVLEGGEGVGKTTQWKALREALTHAGYEVVALREPGGTPAGDVLRTVLLDPASELAPTSEALLFAASRAQLVHAVIRPALDRGAVVLVDRFLLSTYAYQGAGRGLPIPSLRAVNAFATNELVPMVTLLLTMPLEQAMTRLAARGGADRLEQAGEAFHRRVHLAFREATAPAWQAQHPDVGPVFAVDADGSVEIVTARCLSVLASACPALSLTMVRDRGEVRYV